MNLFKYPISIFFKLLSFIYHTRIIRFFRVLFNPPRDTPWENIITERQRIRQAETCIDQADLNLTNGNYWFAGYNYRRAADCYQNDYNSLKKELKTENNPTMREVKLAFRKHFIQYAESNYRLARKAFEDGGFYRQARELYVSEKDTQRKAIWEMKKEFLNKELSGITTEYQESLSSRPYSEAWGVKTTSWLFLSILKWTCNYGEGLWRFVFCMVMIIGIFSIIYFPNPWGCGFIDLEGAEWTGKWFSVHNISTSIHFSIVTFTTLGYGNIHPLNSAAQIVTCVEVIAGYAMFGFLLVIASRKLHT